MLTPKVGVVFLSVYPYPEQEKFFREYRQRTLERLGKIGIEIPVKITLNSRGEVEGAVKEIKEKDVDLLLLCFSTWLKEDIPLYLARNLSQPLLLWSLPDYPHPDLARQECVILSGIVATASNLKRIGRKFSYVLGSEEDERVYREIEESAKASVIAKRLPMVKIGLIGLSCPGMLDAGSYELELRKLGPEIVRLDSMELLARYKAIPLERADKLAQEIVQGVSTVSGPKKEVIQKSAKVYLALKEIVDEEKLDIVGVRCWPELRKYYEVVPCWAFSRLIDEGIVGVCENDSVAGVTMLVGLWLSREPVFLGDLGTISISSNSLRLWHCGVASPKLAKSKSEIVIRNHRWLPQSGIHIEFPLKEGRVTLAKLTKPKAEKFKMFITKGTSIEAPSCSGNIINIRTDSPIEKFMDTLIKEGIEHHLVVSYGDIKNELLKLCELLDIEPLEA